MSKLLQTLLFSVAMLYGGGLEATRQLLVVQTAGWSASSGTLQRYEKQASLWHTVGKRIPIKVGKNGLAWGRGLHHIPKGSQRIKREGDGKAPAGIFALPYAFGESKMSIRYPYHRMTTRHRCVDDSRSRYYNRVIDSSKARHDYHSYEKMKFASGLYSYGLFVDHNPKRIAKAGSCIFIHIKKPSGKPTVGCTAMSKNQIKSLLQWLDPNKHPLLVQSPRKFSRQLLETFGMK